ncbi:hypothetical protein IFM47457_01659 [Aspergillus lentulus]|nr:hypothetical protein IFM47457_01659 [Aspergillus lentulus]
MEHTISFAERNAGLQVGVSNASISANFYSQQPVKSCIEQDQASLMMSGSERPETPPCPLSTVPFRRDPYFVEHGTLFDLIREKCLAPASRIALVGLGGVRKSQLAIDTLIESGNTPQKRGFFWIHASNIARFEQGFREIADRVKIAGRQDPEANIYQLVHELVAGWSKGKMGPDS